MNRNSLKPFVLCIFVFGMLLVGEIGFSDPMAINNGDGPMIGIPMGKDEELDIDICPGGVQTIQLFMEAWRRSDYKVMYELLDETSKKDYSFNDAKFDFQFMTYKEYKLSSIRRRGDNFVFILSYGSWQYGDKEIRKALISGETFKIIMTSRGQVFEKSLESYL